MTRLRNGYGIHKKPIKIFMLDGCPTAQVSLGNRRSTLISTHHLPLLECNSFYAHKRNDGLYVARSSQTKEYLHRLIMKPDEEQEIDHINAKPLDNRLANLRPCTTRQNCVAKHSELVKGYYGIHMTNAGKFKAISPKGYKVGTFVTAREAALYRDELMMDEYRDRYFGEDLHTYGFIHWNNEQDPDVHIALIEMEDYLDEQRNEAIYNSVWFTEEKGWEC